MNSESTNRRIGLIGAFLAIGAIGASGALPALCMTSIAEEISLTPANWGEFMGASLYGAVITLIVAGPLVDRFGYRVLMPLMCVVQAAGLMAVSMSTSFQALRIAATVTGIGIGGLEAMATPAAAALVPMGRTRLFNTLHSAYPAAFIFASILSLAFLGTVLSWQSLYRIIAIIPLVTAILFCLTTIPTSPQQGGSMGPIRALLRSPLFWLCGCMFFCVGVSEVGPSSWIPAVVERMVTPAASESAAASTLAARRLGSLGNLLFMAAMLITRTFISSISTRVCSRRIILVSSAIALAGLLGASLIPNPVAMLIFLTIAGVGAAALWPTGLAISGDVLSSGGATLYALLPAVGCLGAAAGTQVAGYAARPDSLAPVLLLLAIGPLLVIAFTAMIRSSRIPETSVPPAAPGSFL